MKTIVFTTVILLATFSLPSRTQEIYATSCTTDKDCNKNCDTNNTSKICYPQYCFNNVCIDARSVGQVCSPDNEQPCNWGLECVKNKNNIYVCGSDNPMPPLTLQDKILNIIGWALDIIFIISIIIILYGIINYFRAKEDKHKKSRAKKIVFLGILGLILVFIVNYLIIMLHAPLP